MKTTKIDERLARIESALNIQNTEVLSLSEACKLLNASKSYLYKLTSTNQIPFYKPTGKKIFFEKSELTKWLLRNRSKSISEINAEAAFSA